jgi:hypothetical protein
MTYQEIINEITAHSNTVRVLEEPHQGHVFVRVAYYKDQAENIVQDEAYNIIVPTLDDPQQPFGDKVAHYEKKPKYLMTEPPFKTDLFARIAQIQAAQTDLKFYDIVSMDAVEEKAVVLTYWLDTGKLTKKEYGAYRKTDDSIDFIEIA